MPGGKIFQLLTVHPVAPKPSEHPGNIGEDEKELLKAGRLIAGVDLPAMVAEDFNDVGWSHNTSEFEEVSILNDVRCGRGMYNTFSAKSFIFKWPLDYVYVSNEFKVLEIERLSAFGSDHYPLYVQLIFNPGIFTRR
jgi:endonuclease/exonuclease/phosphatase (EEP) superfamily protein YafD